MERCKHCQREKPDYGADMTCAKGGYCEWHDPAQLIESIINPTVVPLDVSWAPGDGVAGKRMIWSFPATAIIEGFEVQAKDSGYSGFIDSLRIGLCEFLHVAPYPILMWSDGMPPVVFYLPSVPVGNHLTIETREFHGRIRPRGVLLNP